VRPGIDVKRPSQHWVSGIAAAGSGASRWAASIGVRVGYQSGWDTDQFPNNAAELVPALYFMLKQGGHRQVKGALI
jgi:hypothetical protein